MEMTTEAVSGMPAAPLTAEDTGVGSDLILQLVVKTLHFGGELTGTELAARLGVRFQIIEPTLEFLKRERQCEIVGGAMLGSPSYRYRLTDAGRTRAALFLEHNQYVGHLPVPLVQYQRYMREWGRYRSLVVTRPVIRKAFEHLVLSDRVLDQLGPAIASRHSLFVYGPPGNGKTVISQAIRNVLVGEIAIPHALAVEGHIVRVFDPVNHEQVAPGADGAGLDEDASADHRWTLCRRPLVTVGGELTLDALELGYNEVSGFYNAPLQMVANGGVLVIDDFGRQHASPRDLLNRWIVPLESRVDYLTLKSGQKVQMPFEALVVFATNLRPSDLVDEAFLRRIHYKVLAESPSSEAFIEIFENCCRDRAVTFDRRMVEALIDTELKPRKVALRGCQPRDLIDQALALASYLDQPREITLDLLSAACATYFVDDREVPRE
jgi:predicted ATPase with chaperone activity